MQPSMNPYFEHTLPNTLLSNTIITNTNNELKKQRLPVLTAAAFIYWKPVTRS